jgi:hypothetical protein
MVEQVKERARNLEMSFRPATFANWTPSWLDLIVVALSWVLVVAYFAERYQRKRGTALRRAV